MPAKQAALQSFENKYLIDLDKEVQEILGRSSSNKAHFNGLFNPFDIPKSEHEAFVRRILKAIMLFLHAQGDVGKVELQVR